MSVPAGPTTPASPAVPERFAPLHAELAAALDAYAPPAAPAVPAGQVPAEPLWGVDLWPVNPYRGPALLGRYVRSHTRLLLARLRELGCTCCVINLHEDLFRAPEAADYLALYGAVVDDARAAGLGVICETSASFRSGAYARGTDLAAHRANRKAAVDAILERFGDRLAALVVADEPRTEAALTALAELRDRAGAVAFAAHLLEGTAGGPCRVGAGLTTGEPLAWCRALLDLPIQVLSVHSYALQHGGLARLAEMAQLAGERGVPVGVGEAWLLKAGAPELLWPHDRQGMRSILARDVFAFWDPLDAAYLERLAATARAHGLAYCAPFWGQRFYCGLPYDDGTRCLGYDRGWARVGLGAERALQLGTVTPLGAAWRGLIQTGVEAQVPTRSR